MTDGPPDAIASFYDAHPYPPPVEDLERTVTGWSDGRLRRIEHARLWPRLPFRDDHDILVAGCGTSQAARYAAKYPKARVIGIDVSPTSLAHTRQLAERHGLDNLNLEQLPIEDVHQLRSTFDHIVCTGVLHHLAEPAEGLAALSACLAPTGALEAMVYAPYGRAGIYMIQEYCRLLDITPEDVEIRDLIRTLRELPHGHPLGHLLRETPDFRDDDALADALLNPRDQAYSVPQLLMMLHRSGLRFARWVRQAPYVPETGVLASLPHGRRVARLPRVEQYRALELFRGTMTRHSFIAYRRDAAESSAPDFGPTQVGHLVPIRVATAMLVERGLPAGASAALLNRAHVYPDLVLFVDEAERRIFEAIDGERSIDDLDHGDTSFFERLWWRDLIVVDASGARPTQ